MLHWHAVYVLIPKMLDTFRAELLLEREHCEKKHGENLVRLDRIQTDATSVREAILRMEARAKA